MKNTQLIYKKVIQHGLMVITQWLWSGYYNGVCRRTSHR